MGGNNRYYRAERLIFNMAKKGKSFILKAACPAGSGIVAGVTSFLFENDCYLLSLQQFDDEENGKFFMRTVFRPSGGDGEIGEIREKFPKIARKFKMEWAMHDPLKPVRVLIMASKSVHCLRDLLHRREKGELPIEITAIVSNHESPREIAEKSNLRFVCLPVTEKTKLKREKELLKIIGETDTELVVLARYMRVLSGKLAEKLSGRCINIHHSFLPAFKGAKPYHQAHERGVKLIGATAHYVTRDLDGGPIIEQMTTRVDHNHTPEQLARAGEENECAALAKAIKYHIERRIFLDGEKTVIL